MKIDNALVIASAFFLTLGAATPAPGDGTTQKEALSLKGTIVFVELEGGFYGIIADSGERYFPINLDQPYKVNNLKVRIEGKTRKNVMTTIMWGVPFEILKIERQ
jgi:hypothetical protein